MCGFAGFLLANSISSAEDMRANLQHMASTLWSRGPDDSGVWFDSTGVGLAHRRLSILDLSPAGHQPMVSACERYVIAYNGEIYNHLDLRAELQGFGRFDWRGNSDTETLLAGFSNWGVKETLKKCTGMFAFALWDRASEELTLARDRMGEKPLYYGWVGKQGQEVFVFGSELKSLKAHPLFDAKISRDALRLYMRYNYIPAPYSIFESIHKLLPGQLLTLKGGSREQELSHYWSLKETAETGVCSEIRGSAEDITNQLEAILRSAVSRQMLSDVPLGAFLSGGVDSSTIVALMQAQSSRPIKTFTIGFDDDGYNEAVHASAVAKHLGTEHTELYVTAQRALEVIPNLPHLFCEPFADSSQIPTFLVSQLARSSVTVALSGDAGDELFCGYNRYLLTDKLWRRLAMTPKCVRSIVAAGVQSASPSGWDRFGNRVQAILPANLRLANLGEKLHKGARVLSAGSVDELYLGLLTHWNPDDVVIGGHEPATALCGDMPQLKGLNTIERMMTLDAMTYLPDDILVKVDRASMGVSLECRAPFLDHRVVEFAWRIPQSMKLQDGVGKWILRQVLYRHVPKALIERPKMGFAVPIDAWLRGPLRDWAECLLDEGRLRREGYFRPEQIRTKWAEHLSGKRNWQHLIWGVLMFQAWLEVQE